MLINLRLKACVANAFLSLKCLFMQNADKFTAKGMSGECNFIIKVPVYAKN